ncbi:MAG: 5-methylcytosine-specific restriction endonuclease McrA [Candidatus Deianiraeaceae bacterium]|jgi:5-methylcytosine-specific restriction endonuclease McrA
MVNWDLLYAKISKYHYDYSLPVSEKYLNSHYRQFDADGKRCRIRVDAGKERVYYPEEGVSCNDWWGDIPSLNSQARERTGYPTQKPLALLDRIIKASSKEGDLVLDPFCGCATTCVASEKLKRKWIGIDIEAKAVEVLIDRLEKDGNINDGLKFKEQGVDFIHRIDIPQRTDIEIEVISKNVKEQLFKEQKGHCKACDVELDIWHFEVDHIIPKAKGGGDYYENYQLLCSNCNRVKGARPMEYLRAKIKTREKYIKKIQFGE